jgi:hypothetical protein
MNIARNFTSSKGWRGDGLVKLFDGDCVHISKHRMIIIHKGRWNGW